MQLKLQCHLNMNSQPSDRTIAISGIAGGLFLSALSTRFPGGGTGNRSRFTYLLWALGIRIVAPPQLLRAHHSLAALVSDGAIHDSQYFPDSAYVLHESI